MGNEVIEPGDHVRIGDGDVDWVVQTLHENEANWFPSADLSSGMTGRMMINVPMSRLNLRVKAMQ